MYYTVTKKTDADLAGRKGRLVMQFQDGSAIEVSLDEVKPHLSSEMAIQNNNEQSTILLS